MPIKLGDAILYLASDDSKLGQGLSKAKSKTTEWAKGLGGTVAKFAGGAVLGGATAAAGAVAGIGVAAFNTSQQIQDAQNQLQTQLGITEEEAQNLGDVGLEVFKNNFGGSIEEATLAVAEARRQLGELSDSELQQATESAFALSDAFGVDVSESMSAARTLTEEFGLGQQEAFDLITAGFQNGLNNSGDFLDSLGEYSNLFADTGLDAAEMFSLLETGMAGGALGTDKIADAVKEFGIIANEGGEDVKAAFGALGMDFEQIQQQVANGEGQWGDYLGQIITGLQDIDDPILRNQTQVALFGTMAEDLGTSFTDGLSVATTTLEDVEGATESLNAQYDNLGSAMQGLKREAQVALAPIGDLLLQGVNAAMPYVEQAVDWFTTVAVPVIEDFATKAGQFIADFIARAGPIIDEFSAKWEQNVGPAIMIARDALSRISEALGLAGGDIDAMEILLAALKGTLDAVIIAVQLGAVAMDGIAKSIEWVSDAVRDVIGWFDDMAGKIGELNVPDWLKPGSPPPLYYALQDISGALKQMPDMGTAFGLDGMPADQPVAVGGDGAAVTDGGGRPPMLRIDSLTIYANDEEGGRRAGTGFLNTLREQGLVIA